MSVSASSQLARSRHFLRAAGELRTQARVLCGHTHRAGIGVTLPHHQATHRNQAGGADTELLGAQHGGDDNVAARLQSAIDPEPHPMTQAIERQHLVDLGKSDLPR